jgi:hypothetical protein
VLQKDICVPLSHSYHTKALQMCTYIQIWLAH